MYIHTIRNTENLPFSADTLRRFSEGSHTVIHGRPCGNTQIVCVAMRGRSADLYNAEEVLELTRKRTHSIEDGYWLLKQYPCSHSTAILPFVQVNVSHFRSFSAAYEGGVLRVYIKALYSYVHFEG